MVYRYTVFWGVTGAEELIRIHLVHTGIVGFQNRGSDDLGVGWALAVRTEISTGQ